MHAISHKSQAGSYKNEKLIKFEVCDSCVNIVGEFD